MVTENPMKGEGEQELPLALDEVAKYIGLCIQAILELSRAREDTKNIDPEEIIRKLREELEQVAKLSFIQIQAVSIIALHVLLDIYFKPIREALSIDQKLHFSIKSKIDLE